MRFDLYTKAILTIIAGCLLWMCLRDTTLSTTVQAREIQKVIIVGWEPPLVNRGMPGVPVYLTNTAGVVPVQIQSVGRGYSPGGSQKLSWEPLPVTLADATPTPTPSPTP
jgi:hypothetical protein